jgi:hypothetical protein
MPGKYAFYLAITFLSLSCGSVLAQDKGIPISVSFFNEATAIPYTRFISTPIHPGIQAGTDFTYKVKGHSRIYQTINVMYFFHNYLEQGFGINTEFGYEYRLKPGIEFSALLGVGYLHTFATTDEFTLSDGRYVKKADWGNPRLYPSLALEVGYYLKKAEYKSPKVFVSYQSWIEYPFSPGFIPVMTHISLYVGARFFIPFKH